MDAQKRHISQLGAAVTLPPSDIPRGPPRAIYELGVSRGTSYATLVESPLFGGDLHIKLYFIAAKGLFDPPSRESLPNYFGLNWVSPTLNRYISPQAANVPRCNEHHILLPELPPFVTPENSKISVCVGPGGTPEDYEANGHYVYTRSQDDTGFFFVPPEEGIFSVTFQFRFESKNRIETPLPPRVPTVKVQDQDKDAANIPRDQVLDTLRIDIEQQGFPNYLSLHLRVVSYLKGDNPLVQPRLFNMSTIDLRSTHEETGVDSKASIHEEYLVRMRNMKPVRVPTYARWGGVFDMVPHPVTDGCVVSKIEDRELTEAEWKELALESKTGVAAMKELFRGK